MEIEEIISTLESFGLIEFILPFLVIFTLLYIALHQSKLFNNKSNVVISLCLALISVILHVINLYHPCWDLVVIIRESLPQIAVLLIGVISLVVISAIIGIEFSFLDKFKGYVFFVILAFVGYAFLTTGGPECYQLTLGLDSFEIFEYLILLLIILLPLFLFRWVFSKSGS